MEYEKVTGRRGGETKLGGPGPSFCQLQYWLTNDDRSDLLSKDDVHLPRYLFICEMNAITSQMAYLSWQGKKKTHSTIQIRELGIEPTLCLLFKEISYMLSHHYPWWDSRPLLLAPFYRKSNWGTEWWTDLGSVVCRSSTGQFRTLKCIPVILVLGWVWKTQPPGDTELRLPLYQPRALSLTSPCFCTESLWTKTVSESHWPRG